jgi:membrane associated rhomboid family serine protease
MNGARFGGTPPVVKNLIIINVLMLFGTWALSGVVDLTRILGLFFFKSENFEPYQIVTHMFMHGGLWHLFINMFMLWMFGRVLEAVWGSKRFFIFYIITGLGAAFIHSIVNYFQYQSVLNELTGEQFQIVMERGYELWNEGKYFQHPNMRKMQLVLNIPTVGASGAVYGVLLAFGMLFPNTRLMLIFPPIPIKAKYMVIIAGAITLYLGITQPGSSIAHFAHLGGMLFGFILIKIWKSDRSSFY